MSEQRSFKINIIKFLGTSFGAGYLPVAPGTWGTLITVLILWFLPEYSTSTFIMIAAAITVVGVFTSFELEKVWGKDPGKVTIDESAGMAISLIALPKTLPIWIAAFILFRLFDIFKPPPVNWLEKLPGGWGIMADDVFAGIYANLVLWILVWNNIWIF